MGKSTQIMLLFSLLTIITTKTTFATITKTGTSNNKNIASARNFIKASCTTTRYPTLCVQSLSIYATTIQRSPKQLAQTALSLSLTRAQSTKSFVSKLTRFRGLKQREIAALKDCLVNIDDTVDRLSKSVSELRKMGSSKGGDFQWHMSNVQTWVSAALTDETTCVDGFGGRALNGRVKNSIKSQFVHVAQVTTNALALINKFASYNNKHQ